MLVKDEEKMLPACLESVKSFIDEMIIVDTGSKDQTIEIKQADKLSSPFPKGTITPE